MARQLTVVRHCPPCATGNHRGCTSTVPTRPDAFCECGEREHDPTVEVAAQMAAYVYGPAVLALPVEQQATRWRQRMAGRR